MTQILGNVELITKQEAEAMLGDAAFAIKEDISRNIVSSDVIDTKIETACDAVSTNVNTVSGNLDSEATTRAAEDNKLDTAIKAEATTRAEEDKKLKDLIDAIDYKTPDATLQDNIDNVDSKVTVLQGDVNELKDLMSSEGISKIKDDLDKEVTTDRDAAISKAVEQEVKDRDAAIAELKKVETKVFEDKVKAMRFTNLPFAQITLENTDKTLKVNDTLGTVTERYLPLNPVTFNFATELEPGEDGKTTYAYISARLLETTGQIIVLNVTPVGEVFEGNINSATVMYITKE